MKPQPPGLADRPERADWVLTTLARLIFSGTLLIYFWVSGLTKTGDGFEGLFTPSVGAYAQIFPRAMEAVAYDIAELTILHKGVVLVATWSEFILPALIVVGLLTRISALGMIVFVVVQSLTDLIGHGGMQHTETLGAWFDRVPDGLILDQRAYWIFLLLVIAIKGAGPISLDNALRRAPLN